MSSQLNPHGPPLVRWRSDVSSLSRPRHTWRFTNFGLGLTAGGASGRHALSLLIDEPCRAQDVPLVAIERFPLQTALINSQGEA